VAGGAPCRAARDGARRPAVAGIGTGGAPYAVPANSRRPDA
jgi:hypothetical protein